jgi:hypothetical protein
MFHVTEYDATVHEQHCACSPDTVLIAQLPEGRPTNKSGKRTKQPASRPTNQP